MAEAADPGTLPAEVGLSRDPEAHLLRIFSLFVATGEAGIRMSELQQFLLAADVKQPDTESAHLEGLLERVFGEKLQAWDFLTIKDMMCNKYFYRLHAGRHFVAVSLSEAETLRAIMHAAQGGSLAATNKLSMALWYGDIMLDASDLFAPAHVYQETIAQQCFRFFNSQHEYTGFEMRMLLRSLQVNTLPQRHRYFENVRQCRRRNLAKWQNLKVRQIFELQDEYRCASAGNTPPQPARASHNTSWFPRDERPQALGDCRRQAAGRTGGCRPRQQPDAAARDGVVRRVPGVQLQP